MEICSRKYLSENMKANNQITLKEKQILLLKAEGMSGKQIAAKLGIAENTVANHRKSLLKKTDCKNMAELIRYAMNNNIVE
jgi:DNA-binding CsgD family transcriptional regulator